MSENGFVDVAEIFGENVFNDAVMQERLPKKVYKKLKEVIETIPLEKILLETDCPYMAPEPYRGKRNSSLYLPYVVEKIAGLKGVTAKEVEEVTYRNAEQLFLGK